MAAEIDPEMMAPSSCDTFVVMPPASGNCCVIFGKNCDRPAMEVQEVVYFPPNTYPPQTNVKCTYVEIPQVEHTYAVVLSRPAWMWGAEMGANEHGVSIGNEAVWTRFTDPSCRDWQDGLLGMDYLRLGLERGRTAREALNIMTALLSKYGQGGRCFEEPDWAGIRYCNSFLICDRTEAWVLETAGKHWVAERVRSGVRNISNVLTIGEHFDLKSDGLVEAAVQFGWWDVDRDGPLHFARAFAIARDAQLCHSAQRRYLNGKALLEKLSRDGKFIVTSMFRVCRDTESGICKLGPKNATVASMVSRIPQDPTKIVVHWFTATPNPTKSIYKPFVFTSSVKTCPLTASPDHGDNDPARAKHRFEWRVDRMHPLYRQHASIVQPLSPTKSTANVIAELMALERKLVANIGDSLSVGRRDLVFWEAVDEEMKLYDKFEQFK